MFDADAVALDADLCRVEIFEIVLQGLHEVMAPASGRSSVRQSAAVASASVGQYIKWSAHWAGADLKSGQRALLPLPAHIDSIGA
jgi:hypothetical protein